MTSQITKQHGLESSEVVLLPMDFQWRKGMGLVVHGLQA
jgi:hypothetical protein